MRDKGGMEQVEEQKGPERVVSFKNAVFPPTQLSGVLKMWEGEIKPRCLRDHPKVSQLEQPFDARSICLSLHTTMTPPWGGESDVYK